MNLKRKNLSHNEKKIAHNIGMYFITDSIITKTSVISQVNQALNAGVRIIQYREKSLPTIELYNQAMKLKKLINGKAILIINDRIDICLAVDADGVHLGSDDIPYADARRILGSKIIGLSTHNINEAINAESLGADYISIGPIFPTMTKHNHQEPVGTDMITDISKRIKIPFIAIGGINKNNIQDVLNAGARNVAIISDIVTKIDITKEIKSFELKCKSRI